MDVKQLEQELRDDGEIVIHAFEEWAEKRPNKTFFHYGEEDRRITFAEFNRLSNSIAHNLRAMGVQKGDRVSLFLMNPLVTTLAMFGIWKIGAIYCPINFNYQGRLLSYQLNDTQPKALVTEQARVPLLNQVRSDIAAFDIILHSPKEAEHDYDPEHAEITLDKEFRWRAFERLLQGKSENPATKIEYGDTANIIYTSGTTGPAKGVVQPYRWIHNYVFYNLKFQHPDDVVYNDLPLYHVAGAFANIARAAWTGCTVAVWDKFSPFEFWQRIQTSGATSAILIDVMIPWLLIPEETPEDRYNTLKQVHMQPLPEYHNKVARRFGFDFVSVGYGQTEAGAGCVGIIDEFGDEEGTPKELYKGYSKEEGREMAQRLGVPVIPGNAKIKKGFMGHSTLLLRAAILNEHDEELPAGKHGHLAFRETLPSVLMKEYFNKPQATLETFRNSWFHTGDGAYRDEDGSFYFVDRIGGFIRRRGENISSYQIEDIMTSHPKVGVCAAFPIPAEEGEEDDIVVFIVVQPGEELSEEELRVWIKAEMPKFMRPKHIRFVDLLPQTPTFKVEKYKLREKILRELGRKS
ncbi:MAG: acyl-CoA synthetase [Candidatus Abyssobacteria bacterium SURF_17]|uniref:Acyl-CoA synthetase n=1 Tax=Candidatus Abyssobacteria bacterium SURF_17 TaxID=2093361 RepID=A0A419EQC8_9BACT|nr:MAG: acyl-CoA synthetase [Candidatus Abyssubacteria bacterium SURF_17]